MTWPDTAINARRPCPSNNIWIDTAALIDNWRALDTLSGSAATGAAVKANCYGLGVGECVPALLDAGCETFFVANWDEAQELAGYAELEQIVVLQGPVTREEADYARNMTMAPVINSIHQARLWNERGGGRCHLMIDTGINRLGISPGELRDPAIQSLDIDILMSHLACADEDHPMNETQLQAFRACLTSVDHKRASLANSAGIALGSEFAFDLTRPGLSLYGGVPRKELATDIKQVAHIEAFIMQVRTLSAGDSVGYNAEFTADKAMRVGTVSIGYADGFLRARGKDNSLFHSGGALPILGKVSMDMVVVDLTTAPELAEGDWLNVPFDLPVAAQQSHLSQYELLTVLGHRLRS